MRIRHRRHANPFTLRTLDETPDWLEIYGRKAPMAVDVGFGAGAFLLELARRHPEWNVLGLEIRPHLVEGVLQRAAQAQLTNLYAVLANANFHTGELLPNDGVVFASINFPDPWYKKRHHKRRVVQPAWLDALIPKLAAGAEIHAMSDYQPIAEEIRALLDAHPAFENLDEIGTYAAASTTGIVSEREQKHLERGDPVYRMRFRFRLVESDPRW